MSYFLANENGHVADFATTSGLTAFRKWVEGGAVGKGALSRFVEDGYTDDPQTLARAIEHVPASGDNGSLMDTLWSAAEDSTGVLILTDGLGDDVPEARQLFNQNHGADGKFASDSGVPDGGKVSRAGLDARFPHASDTVDGRKVREYTPNLGSIDSSLDEHELLPGVREVKMSEMEPGHNWKSYSASENKRTSDLADEIAATKEINPLILAIDGERHPYVLEGGHRYDALTKLGAKSFPARIAVDTSQVELHDGRQPRQLYNHDHDSKTGEFSSGAERVGRFIADAKKLGLARGISDSPDRASVDINGVSTILQRESSLPSDHVLLDTLKSSTPQHGAGTLAMGRITKLADKHGVTIALHAEPLKTDKPISLRKLKQFYQGFGFRTSSERGGYYMKREPQSEIQGAEK